MQNQTEPNENIGAQPPSENIGAQPGVGFMVGITRGVTEVIADSNPGDIGRVGRAIGPAGTLAVGAVDIVSAARRGTAVDVAVQTVGLTAGFAIGVLGFAVLGGVAAPLGALSAIVGAASATTGLS